MTTSRRGLIAAAAGLGWCVPQARAAEGGFPSRPVKFLVGMPAGGAPDVIARILADRLSAQWGQPVIVDNRPAASGNLAAQAVARGETDGHTLLFAHASMLLLNEGLMRNVPFNGERDFTPVSLLMSTPFMVAARPGMPASTLAELGAYARSRPGPVTFATISATGLPRFVGERLRTSLGIEMVNVPYSAMSGAVQDTIAGRVDLLIDGTPVITPQAKGGFLKALAVTSPARFPGIEEVPTAAESIPGFSSKGWFGLLGPAGMPEATVQHVAEAARSVLAVPELRARLLQDFGGEVVAGTPAEFRTSLVQDRRVYRELIAQVGASIE